MRGPSIERWLARYDGSDPGSWVVHLGIRVVVVVYLWLFVQVVRAS